MGNHRMSAIRQSRVLVYTDARPEAATYQIRISDPLNQAGIEIISAGELNLASIPRVMNEEIDALVVHRGIRKRCPIYGTLVTAARRAGKPVIYDIDDLLIQVSRSHPDFPVYQSRALSALKVLLDADLVVASTQVLAEHLHVFHPHVLVIPNRLPTQRWEHVGRDRTGAQDDQEVASTTIGYIGTRTHVPDLASIEGALLAVLNQYPNQVRFLSVGVPLTPGLRRHRAAEHLTPPSSVQKNYADFCTYAAELPIDIGIAPLLDTPFNCCKSDIKWQEYSALGIPGVYCDLPPYQQQVQDGVNGFRCRDQDSWRAALSRLVESASLRQTMGSAALDSVQIAWTSASQASTWRTALELSPQFVSRAGREAMTVVMDQLLAYQADLQRQVKRNAVYQVMQIFRRFAKMIA